MSFYQTEQSADLKPLQEFAEVRLYQNNERYRISVFVLRFVSSKVLEMNWRKVSALIATSYQSRLVKKENEFEKWNIYIIFLCNQEIEKKLRYEIENDKFSTRKITIGGFKGVFDDNFSNTIISQHITNIDLVINSNMKSEDLQDIASKYKPQTFVWEMIKEQAPLNYKTESQKSLIQDILKRIKNEDK